MTVTNIGAIVSIPLWLAIGVVICGYSMSNDSFKPLKYFAYHSDEPGCRANAATEQLAVDGEDEQWIVIAPRRVVAVESEQKRAGGPLDIEIAEPLQSALRKRLVNSGSKRSINGGHLNVTRIKIISVSHDVVGLGMGKAQAHLRLDFCICVNGDVPQGNVVKTVARNGPDMSTLWHQPRGEQLREGFRKAADQAFNAIVDFALRPRE